jgi:poly(A) polymerase
LPSPTTSRDDALAVVRRLRDAGHVAYFAGGCVRDELLGLEPKDYDIATDAPPQRVRELFTNTQAVGAAFGVILVRHRRSMIQVATFRTDVCYEDGRRPTEVKFTTAEQDAQRRDFTINGLFLDPIEDRVIDYVGGREDLQNKVLRAIGEPDRRFEEDHLRLLRAVRFAARFGLDIEPRTSAAIRAHAPQLRRISPERIADELRLIFAGQDSEWAWKAMRDEYPGLAETIFRFTGPPLADRSISDPDLVRGPESGAVWPFGLSLAAAALEWSMYQAGSWDVLPLLDPKHVQQMVRALRQSLRISNEESEQMEGVLAGLHMLLGEYPPRVATVKRYLARPTADLSRQLLAQLGCHIGANQVAALQQVLDATSRTEYAPPPLITGDDLTSAGLTPGPLFKRVLDEVYDAQLEERVGTKEEALRMALELARE